MLSLEIHLGVTVSPQTPFPTDFVTLPVSASHRRFGSLPLVAEEGHSPASINDLLRSCIPNMLKQHHPTQCGQRWLGVLYVISDVHAWLGCSGLNCRFNTFSATGKACVLSAVLTNFLFQTGTKPADRINFTTLKRPI